MLTVLLSAIATVVTEPDFLKKSDHIFHSASRKNSFNTCYNTDLQIRNASVEIFKHVFAPSVSRLF